MTALLDGLGALVHRLARRLRRNLRFCLLARANSPGSKEPTPSTGERPRAVRRVRCISAPCPDATAGGVEPLVLARVRTGSTHTVARALGAEARASR